MLLSIKESIFEPISIRYTATTLRPYKKLEKLKDFKELSEKALFIMEIAIDYLQIKLFKNY